LQRIRELAVQSANSSNNATDRAALNAEATQLVSEIDRISGNASFNGIKLLDGSYQDQALQVGAGNEQDDRILITIGSAKSSSLGVGGGSSYSTAVDGTSVGDVALVAGGLSVDGYIVGAANEDGVSSSGATTSGIAIAAAINAVNGQSGVTATVQKTTLVGTAAEGFATEIPDGVVKINGVNIGAIAEAGDAAARGAQMTAAINAKSGQTGVVAKFSTSTGAVDLSAADGRNISISIGPVDGTEIDETMTGLSHDAGSDDPDEDAVETVTRSTVKLSSSNSTGITIAGVTAEALTAAGLEEGYNSATATAGAGVSTVDLTTAAGSQTALSTLDKAINTITDMRASMGAYQNRLAASISNLETSSMNLQASRSRILDTDYAKETTNLAKAQIIQQAATAMLAQTNQSAQSVLSLLK
jgi:flagellin